ncbi:MAG: DMT family transporter [Paludibacteraceae bacterium]|nr:DMT family transporter [Paludibacteraceae bacterium]
MRKIVPYLSVVFAMLCWAGAGIAVKEALVVFSPLTLIVLRFSLAILLMLLVGLLFRGHEVLGLQRVEKRDIPLFVLGGLFQPFLYFIFETYTYQSFASPTIAEAMLSTQPIMAPILAFIILREKVTRNNVVGILISTVGMLLLLLVGANNFALGNPWGVLLAIVTVSMSVGYTIILRRIPTRYSSLSIVFYVQLVALVLFYAVWGVFNRQSLQDTIAPLSADLSPVIAVGYLAVFASVTAFILFCYTVRQIGVTRANVFNNVRPVFTALLMWVIFDEQLPIWKWVGIIVIVIGLFISQKQRKIE